jgi:hypothetical protein
MHFQLLNCQISSLSPLDISRVSAMLTTSCHIFINLLSTRLLNVHLRSTPSQSSAIVLPYSFTMQYSSQNCIAKLDVLSHRSSQNLTFVPSPTFHLYPILTTYAAHITPFQKLDEPTSSQHRIFGWSVLYLKSTSRLQILSLSL